MYGLASKCKHSILAEFLLPTLHRYTSLVMRPAIAKRRVGPLLLDLSGGVLVFPLGGNDRLDPPHRELHSRRKRIADVLGPKPMNTEERLLVLRPALELAL